MPLVELGTLSRFDAREAPTPPDDDQAPDRTLRCAAGFYASARQAQAVATVLRQQHGLGRHQLSVIDPAGLTRQAWRREARQWQQHRPRWAWRHARRHLAIGTAAGLLTGGLTGGLAALTGHALLAAPDGLQAWVWVQLGLWAGAAAGIAAAAAVAALRPRHRFDEAVVGRLRQGECVVVVHDLLPDDEAPVLACLQATSRSWCAEAPERPPAPWGRQVDQAVQHRRAPDATAPARPWRGPARLQAR